jgi:hypothetical protein
MIPPANDDESYGIGLYVINLDSSSMPMPLTVPFRHELVGFTVFRSRSFEHGHERFLLHLGYFESARRAEDALRVVRKYYPAALIAAAPAVPPPQHYAVQLEWSLAPIIAANVPRLAILEESHLYTVRMLREGRPQHTPAYPRLPFESLTGAQRWMTGFAAWYNGEHRHSAIRFT